MKKTHIIAGIMVLLAVFILVQLSGEVSPYVDFDTAEATTDGKVKIVGTLVKEKPMEWDPVKDPNYFSFFLRHFFVGLVWGNVLLKNKTLFGLCFV